MVVFPLESLLLCFTEWFWLLRLWMKNLCVAISLKLLCSTFLCNTLITMPHKGGSKSWVVGCYLKLWPFKWKLNKYWAALFCKIVCYALKEKEFSCRWNPIWVKSVNGFSSCFYFSFLLSCLAVQDISILTFVSVNEILKCYKSNESYWAVLFCGAVYYAVWCL